MRFRNRADAGRQLAARLAGYANGPGVLILALPRGGVPIGYEIARALNAPLDVYLVRKLGVPGHPELAMGAIAAGGVEVLSRDLIAELGIPQSAIDHVAARERAELERRVAAFRGGRDPLDVAGKTIILVDDGLATGATMEAAILALKPLEPSQIVVAVPVGAQETCDRLRRIADEVVCLATPFPFNAVGLWYEDFAQTSDEEVRELLTAR